MKQSDIIRWYSRTDVGLKIVESADNKEVAVQLLSGRFGKRPNVLQFPKDVSDFARNGVTSFHISVENWDDPLRLSGESTEHFLNELRKSWDLIIDIDCPWFEYSRKTARLIVEYIKSKGLKNIGIKFSGNKGWHIAIPYESFPEKIFAGKVETHKTFPLLLEKILKKIKVELNDYLNEENPGYYESNLSDILKKTGKTKEEITKNGKINFLDLMDIDLAMASPRHLIRSPYSLHEKSGLVSIVIDEKEIESFKFDDAKPSNVNELKVFIDRVASEPNEAKNLFTGIDLEEEESSSKKYDFVKLDLNEKIFPPCMKRILNGLEDGRKRALFSLINFYKNFDMNWNELEAKIYEWNGKNKPPLKKGYIKSQLSWHKKQHKVVPPPNCKAHYQEIGVCFPDNICKKIKNPLSYASFKSK